MESSVKDKIVEQLYLQIICLEKELSRSTEKVSSYDTVNKISNLLEGVFKNETEKNSIK